jgi:hypothetical protein
VSTISSSATSGIFELADRSVGARKRRGNLLHWKPEVKAQQVSGGSTDLNDRASLTL